jgi:indole-3-glycerol phosphate synthase
MNLFESILITKNRNQLPIIAEIKRVIPKLAVESGRPKDNRPAELLVRAYEKGGACGISLVTEAEHFGGEPEIDVPRVLSATQLPLLIKDFILDKQSIDRYRELAAATGKNNPRRVTLLLTAHLAGEKAFSLFKYVRVSGMTALVETRTITDLDFLDGLTPDIIGINNKNIEELEKGEDKIRVTREMLQDYRRRAPGSVIISQSAHRTPADVRLSLDSGADAVLAGTAFMTVSDPEKTVASFVNAPGAAR